jgi:hypothetical protein
MNGSKAQTIELGLDLAAAALFAAAIALALVKVGASLFVLGGATAAGLLGSLAGLRRIAAVEPAYVLPDFAVGEPPIEELEELVLTDADRFVEDVGGQAESELLLEDVLAQLGTDSRVVRLFDAAAMPTPGQLQSRIDDHLARGTTAPAIPDASQALHDALAELRRTLR